MMLSLYRIFPLTMADIYQEVGKQIRDLRTSVGGRGISQEDLAQAVGTTANTVSRWETATYKPAISDLEKLAQYYKGRVRIGRVDVSRNWAIGERFDNREFPTLILLKNGEEASRLKEGFSYTELLKWTEGVLQTESSPPSVPRGEQSAPAD